MAFAVVAVAVSVYAVVSRWDTISRDLTVIGWARTVLCLPLLLAALALGMLSWRRVLAGLGSPLPIRTAGRIYFIGQLGKYLPGSLWPLVAQMELGRDHQIPRRRSAVALIIALLVSMTTGLAVGGLLVATLTGSQHRELWLLLVPVPVLVALLNPRWLWPVLRRLPLVKLGDSIGAPMALGDVGRAVAWSLAGWLVYGLHIAVLTQAFAPHDPARLILVSTGGYALAWCAGMVAFMLPAGAGARDLALILALSSLVPAGVPLAVAVVSRAVTTVADLSWAAVAAGRIYRGRAPAAVAARPADRQADRSAAVVRHPLDVDAA